LGQRYRGARSAEVQHREYDPALLEIQSSTVRIPNPLSTITTSGDCAFTKALAISTEFNAASSFRSLAVASRVRNPSNTFG
jgi:hypothetical protein